MTTAPEAVADASTAHRSFASRAAPAAWLLMVASGFAGLGYQIVWTQQCALWLGHETAAILGIVTAFFGGLAIGALTLGRRVARSPHPARWYAACELLIAAWSLALTALMTPISAAMLGALGSDAGPVLQWSVTFVGTLLLLLPATAAMGATLPAIERLLSRSSPTATTVGGLYAANTAGAVGGVLACAIWLVPHWGLAGTAWLCASLNIVCAFAALGLAPAAAVGIRPGIRAGRPGQPSTVARPWSALPLLAWTGLLGIGFEVVVVRTLSQTTEKTVFTFAMLLAIYLSGTALGAAAYQRWQAVIEARTLRDRLLSALCVAVLAGSATLWIAPALRAAVIHGLGPTLTAALVAELALALAAFGLPSLVMGALFSHLAVQARQAGAGLGVALGVNTAGAALAPLLFGVVLIPWVGAKLSLMLIAAGYLACVSHGARRGVGSWSAAAALALCAMALPPLRFLDIPPGGRLVSYSESAAAAVSVVEDAQGVSSLRIDNRQQEGNSASLPADGRQALLPLLLHPGPARALFLGLGTGVTASVASWDAGVAVDAVELLPQVIAASSHFRQLLDAQRPPGTPDRLHVIAADARRFVRTATDRYDVIVSDNFHPARSGSASLYTVEHFVAVRERLAEGGLFCQWLPLHQLDLDTTRSIVASFLAAFPGARAMLATNSLQTPVLGLVAGTDRQAFDPARLRSRMARQPFGPLAYFGLDDELAVLGSFVAGPGSLAAFAAGAATNTDDRPVVAYLAPRITYAPDSLPRDRLLELLARLDVRPDEVIAGVQPGEALHSERLQAYWKARNRFLEAGRHVAPAADPASMLTQVRAPLLDVLRISPDFRPARDPLVRLANAVARTDATSARLLMDELAGLQAPGDVAVRTAPRAVQAP